MVSSTICQLWPWLLHHGSLNFRPSWGYHSQPCLGNRRDSHVDMHKVRRGIIKVLPMRIHLWLDVAIGLVWIVSPWLLGAEGGARSFLIVMGIISLMAGLATVQEPGPKSAE